MGVAVRYNDGRWNWKATFWKAAFFLYFIASLFAFSYQEADRRMTAANAATYRSQLEELQDLRQRIKQLVLERLGLVFEVFEDHELEYLGSGRISHFGGPNDMTISRTGRTAITKEVARRLNPNDYYCAYKWDYSVHSPEYLKKCRVLVRYHEREVVTRIVDWGPKSRMLDVSPAAMRALGCSTDDKVEAYLIPPQQGT